MPAGSREILAGEIRKALTQLTDNRALYARFLTEDLPLLGRKPTAAMVIADCLNDYYTCLETLFFRIAQQFENHLDRERWHADLLRRMNLEVPGVRPAVISDRHLILLDELRRFRHFRRYYVGQEWDWTKLDFLVTRYDASAVLAEQELRRFVIAIGCPAM